MDEKTTLVPLITEIEIKHRIDQMARQIAELFGKDKFVVVAVLKGAFIFTADLMRNVHLYGAHPQVDFLRASSYGVSNVSSGEVSISYGTSMSLKGLNVLLVDDICDSGRTMNLLAYHFKKQGAAQVHTCVLMDKPSRREVEFIPDFIGFQIPDKFVVGYGLDYAEDYRDVPYIAVLQTSK